MLEISTRPYQIFGQLGSIRAASFRVFSASRGSPSVRWASPRARSASVWYGLAETAFRKHCFASTHCCWKMWIKPRCCDGYEKRLRSIEI